MSITKNSAMDLKNAMFMAHTFRVSPFVVRGQYTRLYPDAHKGLTRAQFVHVMREAMNRGGGGDGEGLTDRGRDLHRTFSILDAPLDADRRPATARPKQRKPPRSTDANDAEAGKDGGKSKSEIAKGIRSLESTLIQRETRSGLLTPTRKNRFLEGSVTPRRISTAAFVPSQRNLTVAAKRPTTSDGRAANVRGSGGNVIGLYGQTAFSRDMFPGCPENVWAARTGGNSARFPFSPPIGARPRTAAEMGRGAFAALTKSGAESAQQDAHQLGDRAKAQARSLLQSISVQLRRRQMQRVDVLQAFEHFDPAQTGHISLEHARTALAELDFDLSISAFQEIAALARALGQDDTVNYQALVSVLSPVAAGDAKAGKPMMADEPTSSITSLSVTGIPSDLGNVLERLSRAALEHRQRIYWKAGGKPSARAEKTFGEQVRALDVNGDGTCTPVELTAVLLGFGLSRAQAGLICSYLVADNNKTCSLAQRGLIRYQLLLKLMHKETAARGKVSGWDSCPVFPTEAVHGNAMRRNQKIKTLLDILEPSERRRLGLAAVYKKMTAEVGSAAKLRRVFEQFDPEHSDMVTLNDFHAALEKLCIRLEKDETVILLEQLDPQKTGQIDYSKFIALMLPPDIVKEDDRVMRKGKNAGPESLKASMRAMTDLTTEEILKVMRDGCHRALRSGPEQLRQQYSMFKASGDVDCGVDDIKRFSQDFGLRLSDNQCIALLRTVDPGSPGHMKYYQFMRMILPPDACVAQGASKGGVVPELADAEFNEGITARLRRQMQRRATKGEAPGVQLRNIFQALMCREVPDSDILRALMDYGVLVDRDELSRFLNNFRSPYTRLVSVHKFIEAIEPEAYEYVFPTLKDVGGADLVKVKREVALNDRDRDPHMWEGCWLHGKFGGSTFTRYNRIGHREVSDQEVRNCLRKSLATRMAHDGATQTNLLKELRECDTNLQGAIGAEEFKVFLFRVGLKVEAAGNLERLWHAIAGDSERLELIRLAEILTSDFEGVPRKSRETVREKFQFR